MGNGVPVNPNGTKGKQSPSWAFWQRFMIPCLNGEDYLFRLRIFDTPWFGVYLHDIFEPDGDRDPHNHPWSFVSIVLRGRYEEIVYPQPDQIAHRDYAPTYVVKKHGRCSMHRMDGEAAHRITYAAPGLKTLIIRGPRKPKGWGFFTRNGYVPWQDYGRDGTK
jgi:hypothetical protein